jgi:hypothetical protein
MGAVALLEGLFCAGIGLGGVYVTMTNQPRLVGHRMERLVWEFQGVRLGEIT